MRAALRGADLLFMYDDDRFVVLLTQTSAGPADAIARRIGSELAHAWSNEDSSSFRIGRATAPEDGTALNDLVRAAESRVLANQSNNRPSIH